MQADEPLWSQHNPGRPTIGFVTVSVGGRYHSELWLGLSDLARERDFNLVAFCGGGIFASQGQLDPRNPIFELPGPENVHGLVISGGVISTTPPAELAAFYRRFEHIPSIYIAHPQASAPRVLVDNREGMRQVVRHLIEVHGYRQIGFVCGPQENQEAIERFEAFCQELAQHDIPFDPAYISPGSFGYQSGEAAVTLFLDERHLNLDAIVGVNDNTALGVIHQLQARGLAIPEDVAVVGFDDIDHARYSVPALSTVSQSLYEQARQAGKLLLDCLQGQPVPDRVLVSTQLALRESCGCMDASVHQAGILPARLASDGPGSSSPPGKVSSLEELHQELVRIMQANFGPRHQTRPYPGWANELLSVYQSALAAHNSSSFLLALRSMVQNTQNAFALNAWQQVINVLRLNLFSAGLIKDDTDATMILQAEGLLGQARVLIAEMAEHVQAYRLLQSQQHSSVMDEGGESLMTNLDLESLKRSIAGTFTALQIPRGVIAVYSHYAPPYSQARLLLAVDGTHPAAQHAETVTFPAKQLVPSGFIHPNSRHTWIIEALHFRQEALGYAVFETGPLDGTLYAVLRRQFSSAIRSALLLQERMQAEETLAQAYKELESFSYSVSHDLRAPLRAIQGYTRMLQLDYGSQHNLEEQYLLQQVVTAAADMNAKIDGLLAFSRTTRSELKREDLDLSSMAEAIFQTLQASEPDRQVCTTVQPGITANGDATLMGEVLLNLLGNAWKYTSRTQNASITFGAQVQSDKLVYFVRDNGAGFDMQYASRLFGAFQRMHRVEEFEGQGIGLALVQRIIRRHGGDIWFDAKINQGATFYFTLG